MPLNDAGEGRGDDVRGHLLGLAIVKSDLLIVTENFSEPISVNAMGTINVTQRGVPTVFNDLYRGLVVLFEVKHDFAPSHRAPKVQGWEALSPNGQVGSNKLGLGSAVRDARLLLRTRALRKERVRSF